MLVFRGVSLKSSQNDGPFLKTHHFFRLQGHFFDVKIVPGKLPLPEADSQQKLPENPMVAWKMMFFSQIVAPFCLFSEVNWLLVLMSVFEDVL